MHDVTGDFQEADGKTIINFNGKSAHAMEPDHGVNAAVLTCYLFKSYFYKKVHRKTLHNSWRMHLAMRSRGHFLGFAFNDEMSGDTTLNAGIVSFDPEKGGEVQVSMRYSVTYPFEEKMTTCMERLKETPFTVDVVSNSAPHHVDANDPLIRTLQRSVY